MSSPHPALLLRKEHSGESFLKLHLLCPENGIQLCLKRVSSKASHQGAQPDLFDTAEVRINPSKQGTANFVADFRVILRRSRIGQSYERLRYASDFANLLILNGTHMAEIPALYLLAERSLDAFTERNTPSVVFLKSVYLLLKDEGYPVRESWWPALPPKLRALTRELIQAPPPEHLSPEAREACETSIDQLLAWLRRETDLTLPDKIN
jgi:hypothetical protein